VPKNEKKKPKKLEKNTEWRETETRLGKQEGFNPLTGRPGGKGGGEKTLWKLLHLGKVGQPGFRSVSM